MPRIALVDDDRNILTSIATMLEAEGFEVEIHYDGQAAWEAFTKSMPDLAVLDIKMPRLDGMDLLQRMRQKTTIPIMFLTAKEDEIDEILGLRMGADDYVKKTLLSPYIVGAYSHASEASGCHFGHYASQNRSYQSHGAWPFAHGPTAPRRDMARVGCGAHGD